MTGRHVGADEAESLGIADRVVAADELLEVALADAARWATGPTVAYGEAKRALHEGLRLPLDEGLALEREAFARCFETVDAREGIEAFIEKRTADFKGA
jgi:enoyl-CoA hydratase/carnithine racemase